MDKRHGRINTIHWLLPKTIPPHCSFGFTSLILSNIRFACLADLAHLIWELPSLEHFEGEELTWPFHVPCLHIPSLRRTGQASCVLQTISLTRCSQYWPAIRLLEPLRASPDGYDIAMSFQIVETGLANVNQIVVDRHNFSYCGEPLTHVWCTDSSCLARR